MFSSAALQSLAPEDIRAFVMQRLRAALPGMAFRPREGEPYRLTLTHPEAGDIELNLGNLVEEVRASRPDTAEQLVNAFVTMAKRAMGPPRITLKSVYPGFRHRAFLDAAGASGKDRMIGDAPGDLVSVVLSDQGAGVATLTEATVRKAGFAPEDILIAAERNFVDILTGAFCAGQRDEGVMSLGLNGYHWLGTSVLFVPGLIAQVMAEKGWSRVLLAAPTRETVDIVNAEGRDAQRLMEAWMAKQLAGPRTQSEVVFTFDGKSSDYAVSHRMDGGQLHRLN
ncbi:MAG: hypothetical protein LJE62_10775 [Silicimonas sp.]|jgi:hypothetical protein|nr:hypothetical protein [Silicimonas sp.]